MTTQNPTDLNAKPPLTVVLGPAGSGKTRWCLDRLAESDGKALLLVPSRPYADRLAARGKIDPDIAKARIKTFGEMLKQIAKGANLASIHPTCQRLTLASLVEREVAPDSFFGRVRGMPGFVDA